MELVDTHCHLQFDKLAGDIDDVLQRAGTAGVKRMVCVGTTLADSQTAVNLASKLGNVWAATGVHPHDAKDFEKKDTAILGQLLTKPKVVAVGEIGLDYFKTYSPIDDQQQALRLQIETGLPSGLPFIFHIREAWADFWPIFDSYKNLRGVVHSFSATAFELDQALSRGLYVGLNGIMTFTNDQQQLDAARQVPLDKLLLETDAPFLAPKAYRGQTCQPKHIKDIAEFLAELRGETISELSAATTKNAEDLFGLNLEEVRP